MNDADSRKLQEVLNWYRQTKGKAPQPRQVQYPRLVSGRALTYEPLLFQVPVGGIPIGSNWNITNAKATCKVLEITLSGSTYGMQDTGDTVTVYNTSQDTVYRGRNIDTTYQRVGVAHKLVVGDGNTDPSNYIWVCEETRHGEAYAWSSGGPTINPSSVTYQHNPWGVVQANNTYLRFDGTQIGGLYQDATCKIVVEWKVNLYLAYSTTADCELFASFFFAFNQVVADVGWCAISKPVSTNNLVQSYHYSGRFIKDITTSSILKPGFGANFAVNRGSMTVQFQNCTFNAYIQKPGQGSEITNGTYTQSGSGVGGLSYAYLDAATVSSTASVVA